MATIAELENELCMGCSACVQACPKRCISMQADGEGFLHPTVDMQQCVDCGLCAKVCAVLSPETRQQIPIAYAAKAKDEAVRSVSSSGGIFTLLAETVLEQGGVVFGAGFDETFSVVHMAVQKKEDLEKLRGSKYVQSRIGDSFSQTKKYLDEGRTVLFSGTPCQIEGLLKFLRKPYDNLITQDIICHGVPSPKAWGKYTRQLEEKYGAPISSVTFRYKASSWRNYSVQIRFRNGKVYEKLRSKDPYMRSFLSDLTLRRSCYSCAFKKQSRLSDFTLADFWGIQHCIPDMDDDKGTSLVICHTEKAKMIFSSLHGKMLSVPADLQAAVTHNMSMLQSAPRPERREDFMEQIEKQSFEKVVNSRCKRPSLLMRIVRKTIRILKN